MSQPGFLNNARFLESKDTRRAVLMVHNDPVETAPALWDSPALSPTMQLEWEPGATDVEVRPNHTHSPRLYPTVGASHAQGDSTVWLHQAEINKGETQCCAD